MNTTKKKYHPFHLVAPSILPFLVSLSVFGMLFFFVVYLHQNSFPDLSGFYGTLFFFLTTLFLVGVLFVQIIKESFYMYHTPIVKKSLRLGFCLFILSEIMLFFAFFLALFYNALNPSVLIGGILPPFALKPFNPFTLPLANTGLLLTSGLTLTVSHSYMILKNATEAKLQLLLTLFAASLFMSVQFLEFLFAPFDISDSVYGSTFFMITGLHGLHVIVGTVYLFVCYLRYQPPNKHNLLSAANGGFTGAEKKLVEYNLGHTYLFYTSKIGTGFSTASLYLHFVDIVLIFVYIFLYLFSVY